MGVQHQQTKKKKNPVNNNGILTEGMGYYYSLHYMGMKECPRVHGNNKTCS